MASFRIWVDRLYLLMTFSSGHRLTGITTYSLAVL